MLLLEHTGILNQKNNVQFYQESFVLQNSLACANKSLKDFQLPEFKSGWDSLLSQASQLRANKQIQIELSYDREQETRKHEQNYRLLNEGQRTAFDTIIQSINASPRSRHFFLQGPSVTGKTFAYNIVCHYLRGDQCPFILTRKQFPNKPSFAITINKFQGQSLKNIGIRLKSPVFTHGQLYVASSRSTSTDGITVLCLEKKKQTENVVYPGLLISNNYIIQLSNIE